MVWFYGLVAVFSSCAGSGGATAYSPSRADLNGLAHAFNTAYDLPESMCPTVVTPGSYRFASDGGDGWAFATLTPARSCHLVAGEKHVSDLATVPPFNADPTGRTAVTIRYTFERLGQGTWQANAGSGKPFPCTPPPGRPPGFGLGAFPSAVIGAWHLTVAEGCADAFYPQFPH